MKLTRNDIFSLVIVIVFPVLMNWHGLFGGSGANPALLYGGMNSAISWEPSNGYPTIDPSLGFDGQAFGKFVATEFLHGRIPWWNPYEGIGSPFNNMFFPFNVLDIFPNGVPIERCVLEIVAGLGTWLLLRELGVGIIGMTAGAVAFSLNGAFCWIAQGVCYTAAFLPYMLLGVDCLRRAAAGGWAILTVSLALSLVAGFPESAYLDGLLVLAWSLIRLCQSPKRIRLFLELITSGLAGIFLAAPVLIAFADFLVIGFAGGHLSGGYSAKTLHVQAIPQLLLPYAFGPIFANGAIGEVWSNVGGYAGAGLAALAIAGFFGSSNRGVRILLALWAVMTIGASLGLPIVHAIVAAVPLVSDTAFARYFPTSWSLALAVLAAFVIDDVKKRDVAQILRRFQFAIVAVVALAIFGLVDAGVDLFAPVGDPFREWLFGSLKWATLTLLAISIVIIIRPRVLRAGLLAAVLIAEVGAYYFVPEAGYPKSGEVDAAPINFLRDHLGNQRFYTLGPIAPNYGTYFGLSELNYNDSPTMNWLSYIHTNLDPYINPVLFVGYIPAEGPGIPSRSDELRTNVRKYEDAGVRYVVTSAGQDPFAPNFESATASGEQTVTQLEPTSVVTFRATKTFEPGRLAAIEVLQGNYSHTADGVLDVRVCDTRGTCATGSRPLRDSIDNTYFRIDLDHPIQVVPATLTVTFRAHSAQHPEAFWTFAAADTGGGESLERNGSPVPGRALRVRFDFAATGALAQPAFQDPIMTIYELRHPRPYFEAPGCALKVEDRTTVFASCSQASELRRLEQLVPGWRAEVNGTGLTPSPYDGIFQRVALPAGQSTVRFSFLPPHMMLGYAAVLFALLCTVGSLAYDLRRARRREPVPEQVGLPVPS